MSSAGPQTPPPAPADFPEEFLLPSYTGAWLGGLLPAVSRSLGIDLGTDEHADTAYGGAVDWGLPRARHAVVVLVDGLGARQLQRWGGHAPFLRSLRQPEQLHDPQVGPGEVGVRCAFPSTTASNTASLGTGLPPGRHGLVGWQTRDPHSGVVFNHLSWEGGPDPTRWQPHPTVFQAASAAGARVVQVSQGAFEHSGLTRSALRGTQYLAANSLDDRVRATLDCVSAAARQSGPPTLVYCYISEVDKAGHVYGPGSWQWGHALEEVDAAVARIAAGLPAGVSLTVTADHGMVNAPHTERIDLAWYPELLDGVAAVGGEPRGVQLYTEPGASADVRQSWARNLGEAAAVITREQALDLGLFAAPGQVGPEVLPRIGDVLALMRGSSTVVHTGQLRPRVLALVGHHGSLTAEEMLVPLLHRPG